jgi:hypothetical protein
VCSNHNHADHIEQYKTFQGQINVYAWGWLNCPGRHEAKPPVHPLGFHWFASTFDVRHPGVKNLFG